MSFASSTTLHHFASELITDDEQDDPEPAFKPAKFDYKEELVTFCEVRKILESDSRVSEKVCRLLYGYPTTC